MWGVKMQVSFSELRAKEVVNTQDGRRLGRVCDVLLCYPDNRWIGLIVPSGKGFGFKKNELFIELKNIVKIGEDVILVNVGMPHKDKCDKRGAEACVPHPPRQDYGDRTMRNFEEFE